MVDSGPCCSRAANRDRPLCGHPEKSLLIKAIRRDENLKMPEKGKLAAADIAC